jgi:hypothetical protein
MVSLILTRQREGIKLGGFLMHPYSSARIWLPDTAMTP